MFALRKKVKMSGKPKRPMSAYMMWLNSAREKIKAENPGLKVTEIAKKAGEIWRSMKDKNVWEEKAAEAREQYTKDLESYYLLSEEKAAQAEEQYTKDLKSYNFVQSQLNKTKPQPGPDLDHESCLLEFAGTNKSTGDGDHQEVDTKNNVIDKLGDIFTSGSRECSIAEPLKPVNLRKSDDVDLLGEQKIKTEGWNELDSLGEQLLKRSLSENSKTFDGFNRKKVKMPDNPKRSMSAYMLWLNSEREKIKAENPGLKVAEIAKKGGEIWRSMKDKSVWEEKAAQAREQYTKENQLNKTKPQPGPDLDHESCLLEFAGTNRSTGDGDHKEVDAKNNVIDKLGDIFTSGSRECSIAEPLKPVNLTKSDDVDLLVERKSKTEGWNELDSLGEHALKRSLPENSKTFDGFNRKKVKMSDNPKRSMSAYMLWLNSEREKIKAENPGLKVAEIAKKGGEIWRSMKDKSVWEEKAAQAREPYTKENQLNKTKPQPGPDLDHESCLLELAGTNRSTGDGDHQEVDTKNNVIDKLGDIFTSGSRECSIAEPLKPVNLRKSDDVDLLVERKSKTEGWNELDSLGEHSLKRSLPENSKTFDGFNRKKVKMSDNPKRSMSAYMLWLNSEREKIKAENPGLKVAEIAKKGGEIWRSMKDKSVWEEKAAQAREQYTKENQLNKTKPQPGPDLDHESCLLELAGTNRSTGDGDHQEVDTKNNVIDKLGDIFTSGSRECSIAEPLKPVNLTKSDDVDLLGEQKIKTEGRNELDSLGEQLLKRSLPENSKTFDGFNRKKVKMSDNPKRSMSAYMLWLNSEREKIKAENPGLKVAEIAKKGGEIWRSMKDKSVWEEKAAQAREQYTKENQLNKTKPQPGPDLDHESCLLELAGTNRSTGDGDHQEVDTKNNVIDKLGDIFTSGSRECSIAEPLKPVNLTKSDDVDLLGEQKIKTEGRNELDSLGEQLLKRSLPENSKTFDGFNRKKVKMSDNPKRSMSAYMLWLNSAREKIEAENPGLKVAEIAKKGGEIWRSMKDKSVWEEKAAQAREQYTKENQFNKTKPQPEPDLDHESCLLEFAGTNRSTGDGDHQEVDTKNNVIDKLGDIFTSGSRECSIAEPLKPVNLRKSDDVDLLVERKSKTEGWNELDSLGEHALKRSLPENSKTFDGFNRTEVKIPDNPKRPMSAYMLWLNSAREKIKAENPGLKVLEIATKGGEIWRSMKDKSMWEEKAAQAREQYTKDLESYNLVWEEKVAQEREQYTKDSKSYNFVQSQLNKTKTQLGPDLDHESCLLEFAGTNRSTADRDHQKDDTKINVIDHGDIFTSGSGECNIAEPLKPVNLGQSDDVDLLVERKSKTEGWNELNSSSEQLLKKSLPENSKTCDGFNRTKVKMPDNPKRPMSAYMLWLNSAREKIKAENPGLKVLEIATKGGEIWRSMKDKSMWEEKAAQAREQYTKDLESYNLVWEEKVAQEREQYTKDSKLYNFVQSQLNKTKTQLGPDLDHESCLLEFAGTNRSTGDRDHQKDDTKNNVIDHGDICTSGSGECNIAEPLKPVNLGQSDDVDLLVERKSKTEGWNELNSFSLSEQLLKKSLPENSKTCDGFNSKEVKMSGKPKRPMSAYMMWLNSTREKIKAENPGLKHTEINKKGGEIWKSMKDKSVWEEKAAQAREQYRKDFESYCLMSDVKAVQAREQYRKNLKSYNFVQSQLNKTKPQPGPVLDHDYCLLEYAGTNRSTGDGDHQKNDTKNNVIESQLNKTKPQPGPDLDHESCLLEFAGTNRSTGDGDHQKDDTKNNVIDKLGDIFTSGSGECSIAEPLKPVTPRQSAKRIRIDSPDVIDSQKLYEPALREGVQKHITLEQLEKHETGCSGRHTRAQPKENYDLEMLRDVKTEPKESSITSCLDCAIIPQNEPDNRIDYFSNLIKEELQYVQPCMRTRMFARILSFLHTYRKFHSNDLDLTDSERND